MPMKGMLFSINRNFSAPITQINCFKKSYDSPLLKIITQIQSIPY